MTGRGAAAGNALLEALVAVFLGTILAAAAAPSLAGLHARSRLAAGTRRVAATLRAARGEAIARGRAVGVVFAARPTGGYDVELHEDTDGDGIQSADIAAGVDRRLGVPWRLGDLAPGVEFSFLPRPSIRKIPPQTGLIANLTDPIQVGPSDIVSFTPLGRCSSGTIYLSDGGSQMGAVVLYGPTGRSRLWRYVDVQDRWVP